MAVKDIVRLASQHRTLYCYVILSVWIFFLVAGEYCPLAFQQPSTFTKVIYSVGMQRYITGSWGTTNFNLNTKIYLRNEINFLATNRVGEEQNQQQRNNLQPPTNKKTIREKVCNPVSGIVHREEGGILDGWTLQGVLVVTRHGDRGPMVHVRDVASIDCGSKQKGDLRVLLFDLIEYDYPNVIATLRHNFYQKNH